MVENFVVDNDGSITAITSIGLSGATVSMRRYWVISEPPVAGGVIEIVSGLI
jgi:hypothetical protein